MALGSDAQWHRFVSQPLFGTLDEERFTTNEGRRKNKKDLHRLIEEITSASPSIKVTEALRAAAIPHSPITPIEEVPELPFVKSKALRTEAPDGRAVRLPPPAVETDHLKSLEGEIRFAPAYGEHTDALLQEIGLSPSDIKRLKDEGVVA
jgi:crotonobetainyl-CoA:carnitine CoA-transferase CaiB-like acyl-CoA transferase